MSALDFFIIGIIGGISPGPITALIFGETLKGGIRNGLKIPLAMVFSNLIVAPLSVLLLLWGSHIDGVLEVVTVFGGVILILMGYEEWRSRGELTSSTSSRPFLKAFMADLINPHPYIFWFTVLAPPLVLLIRDGMILPVFMMWTLFLAGLIGTKILLVLFTDRIQLHLDPSRVQIVLKVLALALIVFGFQLLL